MHRTRTNMDEKTSHQAWTWRLWLVIATGGIGFLVFITLVIIFLIHDHSPTPTSALQGNLGNSYPIIHLYIGLALLAMALVLSTLMLYLRAMRQQRRAEQETMQALAAVAESNNKLIMAVDATQIGLWDLDLRTGQATLSDSYYTMLGYKPGDFPPTLESWKNMLVDEEREATLEEMQRQVQSQNNNLEFPYHLRNQQGQWRWIVCRARITERDAAGQAVRLTGVNMDLTDIHENALLLELQGQRANALLELPLASENLSETEFMQYGLSFAEQMTDSPVGFIHFVNSDQETIELVTWSHNTLAHYCTAAYDNHYPISQAGLWADALRQRAPVIVNDYPNAPNKRGLPEGHAHLQRLISVPVIENGLVKMLVGIGNKPAPYTTLDTETVQLLGNDIWRIVQRRRTEKLLQDSQAALADSEALFRASFENAMMGIAICSKEQTWIEVNPALCQMLGYTRDELLNKRWEDITYTEDLDRSVGIYKNFLEGNLDYSQIEKRYRHRDGRLLDVILRIQAVRREPAENDYFIVIIEDVTAAKQRELELQVSVKALRRLNDKLEEAQTQLLQSEKMASIGQLAAGVAHEINNPIGFVNSNMGSLEQYVQNLLEIIEAYEAIEPHASAECQVALQQIHALKTQRDLAFVRQDIFQLLSESREGLGRVKKIVQDLKDFSRAGETEWIWANIEQGLESTLNIVWNELKYKCKIIRDYSGLPEIYCVPSQINQVFMNLLVNASQAIKEQGTISLRTHADPDQIWVEIADTGSGIAEADLPRIFDPFFTTKPVGQGTGLGLSLSWGIINNHHGRIEVHSAIGQGTTFRVTLPIKQPNSNSATAE